MENFDQKINELKNLIDDYIIEVKSLQDNVVNIKDKQYTQYTTRETNIQRILTYPHHPHLHESTHVCLSRTSCR